MKTLVHVCFPILTLLPAVGSAQSDGVLAGYQYGYFIRSADGAFVFRPFSLIHSDYP